MRIKIENNHKNDLVKAAAEQWLNLVLAHIEHKRQVIKHSKNKNKYAK